jgi:mRNA-degrading endonuclease RelE of RelBE toxin-antitoxin system
MPRYRVAIAPDVAELISHLPPAVKRDARQAMRILCEDPRAGEPLQRERHGLWKYRIRRFRIIYRIVPEQRLLQIMAVGPRTNIYDVVRSFYHSR